LLTLSGITFAAAGGVLALYFSGLNFSISAAIGFVSLFGVSVMNGILLVTYFEQARFRGETSMNAIFFAAYTRMRPILMTSFSACIGLVPAAISTGIGSQVQRPLATVIVGGMLFGPIMLLIVVPALKVVSLGRDKKPVSAAQAT
jgi:cobalt-zinc-cadmium resistance protein CzcA